MHFHYGAWSMFYVTSLLPAISQGCKRILGASIYSESVIRNSHLDFFFLMAWWSGATDR